MWTSRCVRAVVPGLAIVAMVAQGTALGQTRDAGATPTRQPFAPPRDTPAQDTLNGSATLYGRVVTADTGAAVKRAVVSLQGENIRGRRRAETDEAGGYVFTDLVAGRYTVTVSKAGFITLAFGQKHPRQPALPIQVDANAQLEGVNIALPRGSVLTGTLWDEDGEPMARVLVLASRYVYRQGERRIEPAGTDQTDDRGQFRVFDLEPGDYFVSATLNQRPGGGRGGFGAPRGAVGPIGRGGVRPAGPFANQGANAEPTGFAPTYYPGVTEIRQAQPLTLGLSQVMGGIDFAAQLVPMARVAGLAIAPDGSPAAGVQIMLTPADATGRMPGNVMGGRVSQDGSFEVSNVPPGRYRVEALAGRGRRNREQVFANHEITVAGQDVTDVTLMLRRGARISGTLEFSGSPTVTPSVERVTITATPLVSSEVRRRSESGARVEPDSSFVLSNIGPGPRLIRVSGVPDGWQLEAVHLEGRDVIDTPLEFRGETSIDHVVLVLTDQIAELTGTVQDDTGDALTDFTVIAFPSDERLWQPRSRHILTSRPDQNAQYRLRGLPPGDYLLAAVEVVEEGEWFEPRFLEELRRRATRVTLRSGEIQPLNLALEAAR